MKTFAILALFALPLGAVNITQIAAATTVAINVLEAPTTYRKAKAAIKKIRHPKRKAQK